MCRKSKENLAQQLSVILSLFVKSLSEVNVLHNVLCPKFLLDLNAVMQYSEPTPFFWIKKRWKVLPFYGAVDKPVISFVGVVVWVCWHNQLIHCVRKRWGQACNVMGKAECNEGGNGLCDPWRPRQLAQWQTGIALALLPWKVAIRPLLGGSNRDCSGLWGQSGSCAGQGKAGSVMDLKGRGGCSLSLLCPCAGQLLGR